MRDLGDCLAYVDHLRSEHLRIHEAVNHVESVLEVAVGRRNTTQVANCLTELRETLAAHFAEEDEGGCLEEAVSCCPSLASAVSVIEGEHTSILKLLDMLIRRSNACETQDFVESFHRFVKTIHAHEAAENRILNQAFGTGQLET